MTTFTSDRTGRDHPPTGAPSSTGEPTLVTTGASARNAVLAVVALLGLLAALLVAPPMARADGDTLTVTTSDDLPVGDAGIDCAGGGTCTLREAVATGASGDTIAFADGVDAVLTSALGQLLVEGVDLTIVGNLGPGGGPGSTVSGEADFDDRLVEVAADASLTIRNVVLTGGDPSGQSDQDGGAIANRGTLLLDNTHLHGNATPRKGGAVYNDAGQATITGSSVYDNEAAFGGGVYNEDGEMTITDTSFGGDGQGNTAGVTGGALGNLSGRDGLARITILRSSFVANVAQDSGGAIMNEALDQQQGPDLVSDSEIVIRDSTFRSNQAGLGGAILNFLDGASLDIAGSTFVANVASVHGGALFNARGAIEVVNSTFSANTAAIEGGAIMNNGADESRLVLTHVTIVDNAAQVGGGLFQEGVFTDGLGNRVLGGGNTTLTHSILADNAGGDCDGGESEVTGDVRITSTGHTIDSDGSCGAFGSEPTDATVADVMLGDLADNGGATPTHLPLTGSPVIDGGAETCLVDTDQRGGPRPGADSSACDIGAVEVQVVAEPEPEPEPDVVSEPGPVGTGAELDPAPTGTEPEELQQSAPAAPIERQPDYAG